MTTQNLPARRHATTTVAVITTAPQRKTPTPANPESHNWFLLALVGAILAGSAAWGHLWWVALGVGSGSIALGVAGTRARRNERRA